MTDSAARPRDDFSLDRLLAVVRQHWGFSSLRPLQEAAIRTVMEGRDSLLVLPTGGGKSLCYQAPAVLRGDTTVVISPLIALMKDQVDGLIANGIPAAQLNSSLSSVEQRDVERDLRDGRVRLLFASPERLATPGFRQLLREIDVRTFAIDEAHCISHWGHDFRPEYRQLRQIKELFPQASVHGFTATATAPVRQDIVEQLGLRAADVLVGSFDRPNLTYRVLARHNMLSQVHEVLERHRDEAGIIYCLRRKDVDSLALALKSEGINARPYHAGMTPAERKATQDAFADEKCDIVVATVAFGMGIDRSNIRFVLHTGMPKSIEHYQQETGRAGRDGLEAECLLLFSPADIMLWKWMLDKSIEEGAAPPDPEYRDNVLRHIADMDRYCSPIKCRHRTLVEYFGQAYEAASCQACDICLGDQTAVEDAQTVAKKILSCVKRVDERFGVEHVVSVLRGEETDLVRQRGHVKLSTFGLLKEHSRIQIREWIHQLLGQQVLVQEEIHSQEGHKFPILRLNAASWDVMQDRQTIRLFQTPWKRRTKKEREQAKVKRSKTDTASWEGVDRDLFETLRKLRQRLAGDRGVPPYIIFGDATLRDLARQRPTSLAAMRQVYGIGEAKLNSFGNEFLDVIVRHVGAPDASAGNITPAASPAT